MTDPSPSTPTADQVRDHLERHALRPPSRLLAATPLLIFLGVLAMILLADHTVGMLLLFPLIGLVVYANIRVHRFQRLEQEALHIQELTVMRQYRQSLRLAWEALPRVTTLAPLHHQLIACLAQTLDELRAYEAALIAYDYLVDRLPDSEPASFELQARRAMAHLATDRLADADDALRHLRPVPERFPRTPLSALCRLATLVQQVRTHHHRDAVAEADSLLDDLRPLGVRAGYGHGLLAYCFHMIARRADDQPQRQHADDDAAKWWDRATLLLPREDLVGRFQELDALEEEEEEVQATEPPATQPPADQN